MIGFLDWSMMGTSSVALDRNANTEHSPIRHIFARASQKVQVQSLGPLKAIASREEGTYCCEVEVSMLGSCGSRNRFLKRYLVLFLFLFYFMNRLFSLDTQWKPCVPTSTLSCRWCQDC